MCPVLQVDVVKLEKTDVGFVHEAGRVERVGRPFGRHSLVGEESELLVDERDQLVESLAFAGARPSEETADVRVGRHHFSGPRAAVQLQS